MGVSTLVSYHRREIFEVIPGLQCASYRIPESEGPDDPKILLVDDSFYYKPDIDGRQDMIPVFSRQIAESVVHMHITSQLGYAIDAHPALFFIGDVALDVGGLIKNYPSKVKEALTKQRKWFEVLAMMADDDWRVAQRHNAVSDIQRTAGQALKLDPQKHQWLLGIAEETTIEKMDCPFCGSGLLNPNAPICPSCNKVHNPVKLKEIEALMAKSVGNLAKA